MDIGIVGGGINGLCCALYLARQGHRIQLYERDRIMQATSKASSKLLHGGLRYLENGEFRLVREALYERDAWIRRVPEFARPIRLIIPIYKESRRSAWFISIGLFLYDHLAGISILPKARYVTLYDILDNDPFLTPVHLTGGFSFSDGQMDDFSLGHWISEQAEMLGVKIFEQTEVQSLNIDGAITMVNGNTIYHDRVLNITGPWAERLLQSSGIKAQYKLDLVRGSHLVLAASCRQAYILEVPGERRIFFVLPWNGKTLLGTTEVRQTLDDPIACTEHEQSYLMMAYRFYFPETLPVVEDTFAGLRPLLYSANDSNKATREYTIHKTGKLLTVFGGKWTTAMAL
ncbi:MAG: FAD-dependent oxidoreductase, partial [Clostridiales bacterium]|nr:FAD-dependent oxidoreductase [Clostridiales bacterium]